MQILTLNNIGGGGILFQCGTIPLNETFSGFITNLMMCLPGHQTFVWPFPIKKAPFENLLIHPTQVAPGAVDPSQFHRLQVSKLQLGSIHFCWIFLLLNIFLDWTQNSSTFAFAKYVLSLASVGSAKYLFEWTQESFERILSGVLEVLEKQGQQCGVLIKYKKIIGIKYSPYIFLFQHIVIVEYITLWSQSWFSADTERWYWWLWCRIFVMERRNCVF